MSFPSLPTANEVHLWPLWHGKGNTGLLSREEKERLSSYRFEKDRQRYCFTQGSKREILGRYLNQSPETLVFHKNEHGKPSLTGLEFSISHTSGLSALAVTSGSTIGIDIETLAPQEDLPALARHIMSDTEWDLYRAMKEEEKLRAFYLFWTAKEAYLKNLGLGFAIEPSLIEVNFSKEPSAQTNGHPKKQLITKQLSDQTVLQLATPKAPTKVEIFEFSSQD